MHYYLFLYYDFDSGRFTQQVPIALAGGIKLYQYAPNALGWVDPLGLSCGKTNTWNEFYYQHRRHFKTSSEAATAYHDLVHKQSARPLNEPPLDAILLPGAKLNMAVSPGQPSTRPGGFATFDNIPDVSYARDKLAVKNAWKPDVDRVITYEVTQPLPVKISMVGPQIDKGTGTYLTRGGSQV